MIDLEVLSDDPEVKAVCERYWGLNEAGEFVETVREVADGLGITQHELLAIVKEHCVARSTEDVCERCGRAYVFTSRTDYKAPSYRKRRRYNRHGLLCSECRGYVEEQRRREYEEALAEQEAELERLREARRLSLLRTFSYLPGRSIDPRLLTLEDAVYLLSVVRHGATEDLGEIRPLNTVEGSLAPTRAYSERILHHLLSRELISVHPGSDTDSFVFEGEQIIKYDSSSVSWRLTVAPSPEEGRQIVADLEGAFAREDWPDHWQDAWLPLWREIALHECLEYLAVCMEERGFDFNPGEKTFLVFNQVLDSYSVAQAYNLIWSAAMGAADFFVRKSPPRRQAANSVISAVQRRMERARDERWELKLYRRDFRCPRSMVSHVLFSTALHMGDEGFTQSPGPLPEEV